MQRVVFLSDEALTGNSPFYASIVRRDARRGLPRPTCDEGRGPCVEVCNETHATEYHQRPFNSSEHFGRGAVYVHHLLGAEEEEEGMHGAETVVGRIQRGSVRSGWYRNYHAVVQPLTAQSVHLAYSMEPPVHWPWRGLEGFDGEMT